MSEPIIFARFSKPDQIRGHSLDRQLENTREACAHFNLNCGAALMYVEPGKSAYTGAHRAKGSKLYQLEEEIVSGLHRGRTLVVENLDRLSRQGYAEVHDFMRLCSRNGVHIATHDGFRFYRAGEPVQLAEIMEIVLKAELAFEESKKKSTRVREAFSSKREAALQNGAKRIATRPPAWLKRDGEGFAFVEPHATTVREMCRLTREGCGTVEIVRRFNEAQVPTWSGRGRGWHESMISTIITSRRLIGEYRSEKHDLIVLDYYPALLTVEEFNQVQASRAGRAINCDGRRGALQTNLLTGLARCDECGSTMAMKTSRTAGRVEKHRRRDGTHRQYASTVTASYLVCTANQRRLVTHDGERICTNARRVRYDRIEPVVLDTLLTIAMNNDTTNAPEISAARREIAELERAIEGKTQQSMTIAENLSMRVSETLLALLARIEGEIEEAKDKLASARKAAARETSAAPSAAVLKRIEATREAMMSPDDQTRRDARILVADALKSVISSVWCTIEGHALVIVATGIAAFEVNAAGEIVARFDGSGDRDYIARITSGERAGNKARVDRIMARAVAKRAA